MKTQIVLVAFLSVTAAAFEDLKCGEQSEIDVCNNSTKCVGLATSGESPSLLIRDTNGRLGNHMFAYMMLLSLREQFGYRTFITR